MTGPAMCAAQGCFDLIKHDKVMCKDHWDMVPKDMQRRIVFARDRDVRLDETLDAAQTVYLLECQRAD